MTLRIHDTLRAEKIPFSPVTPGRVTMYVCGMTVQDVPHVGHLRSSIVGDAIRRYLMHCGYEVTFVYNFTDVDDKIIAKAEEEGVSYQEVSRRNEKLFLEFARTLNILPATHYPRATEHIDEILELIGRLIEQDRAYPATNGDVYYRVRRFPEYGKLSKKRIDDLQSGARIEVDEQKDDPLDFALWKAAKPGEPSWESPWGAGRPGWHIECSAMSMKYCGNTLDFHGGGEDLIFPHHENEIAQSEGATGEPFTNYWVHNGWVTMGGDKMSKSTKKFRPITEVAAAFNPEAIRLYLMGTHYRSPIEYSEDRLRETETGLARLQNPRREAARRSPGGAHPREDEITTGVDTARQAFAEGMDDDFNTARAVAALFDLARVLNRALDEQPGVVSPAVGAGVACLEELGRVLGLFWLPLDDGEGAVPAEIQTLVDARNAARAARDFAASDRIRDELAAAGWVLEDRADGTLVRRK